MSYRFQAWPLETRFNALGAVFIVTRRAQEANTTYKRAAHDIIYIGQTASLADPLAGEPELKRFQEHSANCVCICLLDAEERRLAVEEDLLALHEPPCNAKQRASRLFGAT